MAKESREWKCSSCGRVNAEFMKEQEEAAADEDSRTEDEVPEQLRLAFREDLGKGKADEKTEGNGAVAENAGVIAAATGNAAAPLAQAPAPAATATTPAPAVQVQQARAPVAHQDDIPAWIDLSLIHI